MTLESKLNYQFKDRTLLDLALTHKSQFYDPANAKSDLKDTHNERLEFLGDAVLDLIISHILMIQFKDVNEGELSKLRASLVNESALSDIAKSIDIDQCIKLSKGEAHTGGAQKPRILASAVEAVIGGVYLDAGLESCFSVVENIFEEKLKNIDLANLFSTDYKTKLQEEVQRIWGETPNYNLISTFGPDHNKSFVMQVEFNGKIIAEGEGESKKQATQQAAQKALDTLKERI